MVYHLDWDGLDPVWRGVNPGVGLQLALDPKIDPTLVILANVFGPHAGERLAHGAECVLHCARSDGLLAGGESTIPVPLSKDLEDRDGVVELVEPWVDVDGFAKVHPPLPMVVRCGGSARNDSGSDRFLHKAKVSAECICGRRWHSSHEDGCG
jgi:hypothetical protein